MSWRPSIQKRNNCKRWEHLSKVCSQILLKCWSTWRSGRPDILWSVHKPARAVTKRTKACGERLSLTFIARVTTDNIAMWVISAQHCRLGFLQDSDFAGDLEDSKSTSGRVLCIFRSRTLGRCSWMCKKQTSTVPLNLRLFLYMQFQAWTVYLLLIPGIWLLK